MFADAETFIHFYRVCTFASFASASADYRESCFDLGLDEER